MSSSEQEIARFIVAQVETNRSILGAQLGALITVHFPGVNFRSMYGGLRAFIRQYCSDSVRITEGPSGKDTLYSSPSAPAPIVAVTETPPPSETLSPWRTITVPESPGRLRVNPDSIELAVVSDASPVSPPWVEVPKLTPADHQQLAVSFLSHVEATDREHFSRFTDSAASWRQWYHETRDFGHGKYAKSWSQFRFEGICKLILDRFLGQAIEEPKAIALLEKLKTLKSNARPPHTVETEFASMNTCNVSQWRQFAHEAIDAMSEHDLRRIWLPMGLVVDAVRRKQT